MAKPMQKLHIKMTDDDWQSLESLLAQQSVGTASALIERRPEKLHVQSTPNQDVTRPRLHGKSLLTYLLTLLGVAIALTFILGTAYYTDGAVGQGLFIVPALLLACGMLIPNPRLRVVIGVTFLAIFARQVVAVSLLAHSWSVGTELIAEVEKYKSTNGRYPPDMETLDFDTGWANVEYVDYSEDNHFLVIVWSLARSSSQYWRNESGSITYIDD